MSEVTPSAASVVQDTSEVERTVQQEQQEAVADVPWKVGDKIAHSQFYLGIMRGNHKVKASKILYEVMSITPRSTTVRPWGSIQTYGPQFPHRYLRALTSEEK